MTSAWLKTRQTKFTFYVTLYILVVVAALGLANWLANRHNKSLDTTANKRFSLSPQTERVVRELKQNVNVAYYDQSSRFTTAKDLLDRYDALSTKLKVDYIDPNKKPQLARAAGVKQLGTVVVESGSRRQESQALTEEEVTGALIRALKGGERNVCFTSGSGEAQLDDSGRTGYQRAKEEIEKNNYKTRAISLVEKPEIPADCNVLVVGGPRYDLTQPAVDAIKKLVEGGGSALFLVDPPMNLGKETIAANEPLVDLLKGWGVTVNKDLVLDLSGIGQLFGFSEAVPLVSRYESHSIVRDLKGVATAFPVARSLDVASAGQASAEKLFATSEASFATTNLSSPEVKRSASDKGGPLTLGAAGTFRTGKENNEGRFVAVGSSQWVGNGILGFNGNKDLLLNMLNWLSQDEDLISIRPKDPEDRRIQLSRSQMNTLFYTSVVFAPLLALLAGIGVWWRRR